MAFGVGCGLPIMSGYSINGRVADANRTVARSRSDDKRSAILRAALELFAQRGHWATPTAAVSRAAGVAEGTLFTYFATKDELLNALYRALKVELAADLLAGLPRQAAIRAQLEHVWTRYLRWGLAHPGKCRVMSQLKLADSISAETHAVGMEPFAEVAAAVEVSMRAGELRKIPVDLVAAMLGAMADATLAGLAQRRKGRAAYRRQGFEMFWQAIAAKGAG